MRDGHRRLAEALVALLKTTLAAAGDGGTEAQSKAHELATAIVSALGNARGAAGVRRGSASRAGSAALSRRCGIAARHLRFADAGPRLCNLAATGVAASHVRGGRDREARFLCQRLTPEVAAARRRARCATSVSVDFPESRAQSRPRRHRRAGEAAGRRFRAAVGARARRSTRWRRWRSSSEESAQEVIRNEMGFKPIGAMLAEVEARGAGSPTAPRRPRRGDRARELWHNRDELRSAGVRPSARAHPPARGRAGGRPTAAWRRLLKLAANAGNEGAIARRAASARHGRAAASAAARWLVGERALYARVHRELNRSAIRACRLIRPCLARRLVRRLPRRLAGSTTRCRSGRAASRCFVRRRARRTTRRWPRRSPSSSSCAPSAPTASTRRRARTRMSAGSPAKATAAKFARHRGRVGGERAAQPLQRHPRPAVGSAAIAASSMRSRRCAAPCGAARRGVG